jgi:hypothetical protein
MNSLDIARTFFARMDAQAADFFGIINQEKLMDLDQVWFLHVKDGVIDRIKAYWCQNRLYRRLGVKRLDQITITA